MTNLADEIAIVGLSLRLPGGTEDANAFWRNLRAGVSSIRRLEPEELEAAGVPEHLRNHPDYVPYAAPLDRFDHFDAEFFGLSPKEAGIMDPQHRQVLELAWEALETAGHPPSTFDGKIGVYAGCGMGSYFYFNICSNPDLVDETGMFLLRHTGNDKDFLSTRVSHALDLTGPSVNIQTACSTSLVAVHYAAEALRSGDCDIALAGGSTIELPQGHGYLFKENEILSPDGQCRAFDHRSEGTVFGSGAGVVALRRLADAERDGDPILAVLKGSAINNDGADKAGYLAPSVTGQAAAIAAAHKAAGVTADTIDYIECHGTGTRLGDPIEVAALTEAFRETTDRQDFCRIGSVKTNIGHLDTAAGVASLAKAALALKHGEIPPSLGYEKPNPAIGFDGSPFRVNDTLSPWPVRDHPRRAGVNSLGVGGTNAHVVLEEAPRTPASEDSAWPFQLLTLSARSDAALDAAAERLADHLEADQSAPLADIAFTLKEGRHGFERRRVVVAETHEDAARLLRENDPRRVFTQKMVTENPDAVFMFPGGGAQYAGMARDLYHTEPVFRDWMDKGFEILQPRCDVDIRALWLPEENDRAAADEKLKTPSIQLPLIMIVEYALAQLWMSWGVKPAALIGHSMGENTAACLAGVLSFEDCIGLVHLRGTLFDSVPNGGMLSVALPEAELRSYLSEDLEIAAVNAPGLSVATGPVSALTVLEQRLSDADIDSTRIAINIAAHSWMLDPILAEFEAYLESIPLSPPEIPFASNLTGTWITDDQATSPRYWVDHLRGMVRFADGIAALAETPDRVFIEVGPGRAMASLAAQCESVSRNQVMGTLRSPSDEVSDDIFFVTMLGRFWAMGGAFDWDQLWDGAQRRRVVLPTYPFQRKQYFIAPGTQAAREATANNWLSRIEDRSKWGWKPFWKPTYADCTLDVTGDLQDADPETWLIFLDEAGIGAALAGRLRDAKHDVITVKPGDTFARLNDNDYLVAPEQEGASYDALMADLSSRNRLPTKVVHLWMVTTRETARPGSSFFHRLQEQGFWSLFYLSRAWASVDGGPLHINVITSDAMRIADEALRYPAKSTVLGPARVIPRELPDITCSVLDVETSGKLKPDALTTPLLEEVLATPGNHIAALRRDKRFEQTWQPAKMDLPDDLEMPESPVILMTGGLGGIGLSLADRLTRQFGARIAFVSRAPLPPREDWRDLLRQGDVSPGQARRLRALMALEAAGGAYKVLAADVSNLEEMQRAVTEITDDWGRISGVVHAAGLIDDAPILAKTAHSIDNVLSAKVLGTEVLCDLFPDGTLDWMALFSSASTVTAPAGQVDYVAANEYLNAIAHARAGGKTRVFAINWGVWAEVGMAADAMAARTEGETPKITPVEVPLLDGATMNADGTREFVAKWKSRDLWVLDEHRTRAGDALLPGTGYLELAAEVLAAEGMDNRFEVRDLTFLSPLRVDDHGETEVRIGFTNAGGQFRMTVRSSPDGQNFETNAEAELRVFRMIPTAPLDLDAITARCTRQIQAEPGETLRTAQEAHLRFGPRWRVLERMAFGDGEGIARLRRPPGDTEYQLPPGLMDIATGWAMELIDGYDPQNFWVPVAYGSARFFGSLPAELVSWVRYDAEASDDKTARFDITLAGTEGMVLAEIEGFTIHRLSRDLKFAAPPAAKLTDAPVSRPLSKAEERLRHNIGQGIPPADGAAAFLQVLAGDNPQMVVSSLDLAGLVSQAERDATPVTSGQTFERPDLDSDYVAPEGEIERRLAGFWSELLGIDQVGADDNFFDLGGHSLIAVRLFAMVKSAFAVDFPISVLFEAPTIRTCAALIEERGGVAGESGDAKPASQPDAERRFTHLVPMSQGDGSTKTPFFLVAGMFGNVLNLRHLAHLIGADRPFYGLQARGLLGGDAPHTDLTEAARDYITEIRKVQPHGPYMIGGFSGGGITAYEIAQQLKEAGEEIAALILLDTPLPQRRELSFRDRMMIHALRLKEDGLRYPVDWARQRIEWEIRKRQVTEFETSSAEFHNKEIEAAFYEAIGKYQVVPWDGPMTLFRPALDLKYQVAPGRWVNSRRELVDPANDWTPHAPNVEVFEVPGDHDSMVLEPNVRVLATRIRSVIDTSHPGAKRKSKISAAE